MSEVNPHTSIDPQALSDEAFAWLVRLHSGHASEDDRRQLEIWRTRSPAHHHAYREAEALWRDVGEIRAPSDDKHVEGPALFRHKPSL